MSVNKFVTVSKPGTTWETVEAAMEDFDQFTFGNEMNDAISDAIEVGDLTADYHLSEDGTSIVFERVWEEAAWEEFSSTMSAQIAEHRAAIRAAGWIVDAEDGL